MLYGVNRGLKAGGRWPGCDVQHRRSTYGAIWCQPRYRYTGIENYEPRFFLSCAFRVVSKPAYLARILITIIIEEMGIANRIGSWFKGAIGQSTPSASGIRTAQQQ